MATTETHCPYCSLQCGMKLTGVRSLEVEEWKEFPVNQGGMCRKGWTSTALLRDRERLTTPLVRDQATGEFRPADWDEALDVVADKLAELRAAHGPDSSASRSARPASRWAPVAPGSATAPAPSRRRT